MFTLGLPGSRCWHAAGVELKDHLSHKGSVADARALEDKINDVLLHQALIQKNRQVWYRVIGAPRDPFREVCLIPVEQ